MENRTITYNITCRSLLRVFVDSPLQDIFSLPYPLLSYFFFGNLNLPENHPSVNFLPTWYIFNCQFFSLYIHQQLTIKHIIRHVSNKYKIVIHHTTVYGFSFFKYRIHAKFVCHTWYRTTNTMLEEGFFYHLHVPHIFFS